MYLNIRQETTEVSSVLLNVNAGIPVAPFQNARSPSSLYIFLAASITPEYVVCPALATTCGYVINV
jgi:hypothetical protein